MFFLQMQTDYDGGKQFLYMDSKNTVGKARDKTKTTHIFLKHL